MPTAPGWVRAARGDGHGERREDGALNARTRRLLLLYGIAAGGAAGEVAGLKGAGMVSTLPLAGQATALPSVAAFHDVRWLLVYASNWPFLAGEVIVTVAIRAAMMATFVRAAWPGEGRPGWSVLLPRAALADFLALVAMSPWAVLSFATGLGSLSFMLIGGIFLALVVGIFVIPHFGIAPRWWARWPPWRAMAWTALDFLIATVAAIAIDYSPSWVVLVTAAAAGAGNAWCWTGLVRACAEAPAPAPSRVRLALVPASLFLSVSGLAVLASSSLAVLASRSAPRTHRSEAPPRRGQHVLLLVNGYGSSWSGAAPNRYRGFDAVQFSYRGLGPRGRPLPYSSTATTTSLVTLSRRFAAEVDRLSAESGRRIDVVAVSEGTWVVREYLARYGGARLDTVVLSSPLPRPDRVSYPGSHDGFGVVAAAEARLLLRAPQAEAPHEYVRVDEPMLRSLARQGPLFRQDSLCPVPGVRIVALLPLSAAVDDPPGPVAGIPNGVVPAVHADLTATGTVRHEITKVLAGKPLDRFFGWGFTFQLVRYASSAWEVPSLPLSFVPAWQAHGGGRHGDAAFGTYGCPSVDHPSGAIDAARATRTARAR